MSEEALLNKNSEEIDVEEENTEENGDTDLEETEAKETGVPSSKKEETEKSDDVEKLKEMIKEEVLEEESKSPEEEKEINGEEMFSEAMQIIEEVKEEEEKSSESLVLSRLSLMMDEIGKLSDAVTQLNDKMSRLLDQLNIIVDSISEMKSLILMMSPKRPIAPSQPKEEKIRKELPSPKEVIKSMERKPKHVIKPAINVDKLLEEAESALYAQEDVVIHAIKIESLKITFEEILDKINNKKLEIPKEKIEAVNKMLKYLTEESMLLRSKILGLV